MNKKIALAVVVVVIVLFLFITKVLTFQGLCGWSVGHMLRIQFENGDDLDPGLLKEWSCRCIGFKHSVSTSYDNREYCTGLNLSINKFIPYLMGENAQYPVNVFEGL